MNARTILSVLRKRHALRTHERWTRRQLEEHQAGALRELRDFAVNRSPFYRSLHRGFERRPLHELPIVTKSMLMEHYDEVLTVPGLTRKEVERRLELPTDGELFVTSTSGTTGQRGLFVQDYDEWTWVLASYARANEWSGAKVGLTNRMRLAVVSSRTPWHQSSLVGATVASPLVPTLRLDATDPLSSIVESLNEFRPEALVGYASMIRLLAEEQLAGRLRIAPVSVTCSSEPITDAIRERSLRAWNQRPFEVYAATEPAAVAAHCERHSMHLFEDLVIAEVVDENDRPVPPSVFGARVLVTVLFSRTIPLIRYAMSDSVMISPETCACGRPFGLIGEIQGRREDALRLNGVTVQPNVFHRVMEPLPVTAWQVVQRPDGLRVLLVAPNTVDSDAVARGVIEALRALGVESVAVTVESVAEIPKAKLGKSPLIIADRSVVPV